MKAIERKSLKYSNVSLILAMFPALLAFIGWAFSVPILQSFFEGIPPMTIETIIGVVLLGGAVFLLNKDSHPETKASKKHLFPLLAVLLVFVMATVTLVYYLVYGGQFAFESNQVPESLSSVKTSVCFLLIVVSIYVGTLYPKFKNYSLLSLLLPFYIIMISITGYVLNKSIFFEDFNGVGMSIPTSISLLLIVAAIIMGPLRNSSGGFLLENSLSGLVVRSLLPISLFFPPIGTWVILAGKQVSLYSETVSIALLIVVPCLFLTLLIVTFSYWLSKYERKILKQITEKNVLIETSRAKDEFLGVLSHELRTPMSTVIGFLDLLSKEEVGSRTYLEYLEVVKTHARAELDIVESILELSSIVAGKFKLHVAKFNIRELFDTLLKNCTKKFKDKNLAFSVRMGSEVQVYFGDSDRLKKVFSRLIDNAIKFTPEGGKVSLSLSIESRYLNVILSDNGLGVTSDQMENIFEKFWQADSSYSRSFGGLGVGLSLVNYIIEAHGGEIDVNSGGKNAGTTFSVKLPIIYK